MDKNEKIKLLAEMAARIYAAEIQIAGDIESIDSLIAECVLDATTIFEKVSELVKG